MKELEKLEKLKEKTYAVCSLVRLSVTKNTLNSKTFGKLQF